MQDGDAHPLAIKEILAIVRRGGDFARALGALAKKRQHALASKVLDGSFERHDRPRGPTLYSVNFCVGQVGVTAVFSLEGGALKELSVVAFDDVIAEAMSAAALNEALKRARQRL